MQFDVVTLFPEMFTAITGSPTVESRSQALPRGPSVPQRAETDAPSGPVTCDS